MLENRYKHRLNLHSTLNPNYTFVFNAIRNTYIFSQHVKTWSRVCGLYLGGSCVQPGGTRAIEFSSSLAFKAKLCQFHILMSEAVTCRHCVVNKWISCPEGIRQPHRTCSGIWRTVADRLLLSLELAWLGTSRSCRIPDPRGSAPVRVYFSHVTIIWCGSMRAIDIFFKFSQSQ
jgi:hypothetical protein